MKDDIMDVLVIVVICYLAEDELANLLTLLGF